MHLSPNLVDLIGWAGALLVLSAYYLVSNNKLAPDSHQYQKLNIGGSFLLIINTFYLNAYPSMMVNIIWVFIGLSCSYKAVRLRTAKTKK